MCMGLFGPTKKRSSRPYLKRQLEGHRLDVSSAVLLLPLAEREGIPHVSCACLVPAVRSLNQVHLNHAGHGQREPRNWRISPSITGSPARHPGTCRAAWLSTHAVQLECRLCEVHGAFVPCSRGWSSGVCAAYSLFTGMSGCGDPRPAASGTYHPIRSGPVPATAGAVRAARYSLVAMSARGCE